MIVFFVVIVIDVLSKKNISFFIIVIVFFVIVIVILFLILISRAIQNDMPLNTTTIATTWPPIGIKGDKGGQLIPQVISVTSCQSIKLAWLCDASVWSQTEVIQLIFSTTLTAGDPGHNCVQESHYRE